MQDVVLISQGNELTTGQTVDTNAAWLSERLWERGLRVRRVLTVPDDLDDLRDVLVQAAALAPTVVCTGGLGPTRDDLTAQAAALAFAAPLVLHPEALSQVEHMATRRGHPLSDANRKQAWLPQGARPLRNDWGTAPGFCVEHQGCVLYFLPGVPREMKPMFTERVAPELSARLPLEPPVRHTIRVIGVPESRIEMRLRALHLPDLPDAAWQIAFRTAPPENQVKVLFSPQVPPALRQRALDAVVTRIGRGVYGVDSGDLAEVVGQALVARGETLALAESCTAGRIAAWVGGVPGASRYLLEGAVVYSNEAKVRTCAVREQALRDHGAVSEPVARQLAEGIRARAGATWGIGVTGIAGPGGGTPDKPVGTVHIAVAGPSGTTHHRYSLPGDRDRVTTLAAGLALFMLAERVTT